MSAHVEAAGQAYTRAVDVVGHIDGRALARVSLVPSGPGAIRKCAVSWVPGDEDGRESVVAEAFAHLERGVAGG